MFLDVTRRLNLPLIRAAAVLHQAGKLPPNSYVVDAAAVLENARLLAGAAAASGVKLFFMAKQFGHDPTLCNLVVQHIPKAVAVDWMAAEDLIGQGVSLGHVGHLVQIPRAKVPSILAARPEVWTIASLEEASWVAAAAREVGVSQPVLLRVSALMANYPGQEGGFSAEEAVEVARQIDAMRGVHVVGATAFPCFVAGANGETVPGPNLSVLLEAVAHLGEAGVDVIHVNAPGGTSVSLLPQLSRLGVTHAEPGHALTGTTPRQITSEGPERPAIVYLTEVSHRKGNDAYVYGGGFYRRSHAYRALVGSTPEAVTQSPMWPVRLPPPSAIDYTASVESPEARPGDTAVMAFRVQAFVARSHIAVVTVGRTPKVLSLCRLGAPPPTSTIGQREFLAEAGS